MLCDISLGDITVDEYGSVTCNGSLDEQPLDIGVGLYVIGETDKYTMNIDGSGITYISFDCPVRFKGVGKPAITVTNADPDWPVSIYLASQLEVSTTGCAAFAVGDETPAILDVTGYGHDKSIISISGAKGSQVGFQLSNCRFKSTDTTVTTGQPVTASQVAFEMTGSTLSCGDIVLDECTGTVAQLLGTNIDISRSNLIVDATSGHAIGCSSAGQVLISESTIQAKSNDGDAIGGEATTLYLSSSKLDVESTEGTRVIGSSNSFGSRLHISDCELVINNDKGSGIYTTNNFGSIVIMNCKVDSTTKENGIGMATDILVVASTLSLTTTSGYGLACGVEQGYVLTILTSTIEVHGGDGVGIGCAGSDSLRSMRIEGSTVTVATTGAGAAIGCEPDASIDSLSVSKCELLCEAAASTGIGGGSKIGQLVLSDCQMINSTGGGDGAGIGGYTMDSLEIQGCTVYAYATGGAAIGTPANPGNFKQLINELLISKSSVTARSGQNYPAIGGHSVYGDAGAYITMRLTDSSIDAFSGYFDQKAVCYSAAIGGCAVSNKWSGFIIIERCTVKAISGYSSMGAGIGGGRGGKADVTIISSDVIAISSSNPVVAVDGAGSGIGSGGVPKKGTQQFYGSMQSDTRIVIRQSRVSAFGGNMNVDGGLAGSGIGMGGLKENIDYEGDSVAAEVTIESSIVYAYGGNVTGPNGKAGAAIMGGDLGYENYGATYKLGNLKIDDSAVYAFAGVVKGSQAAMCALGPSVWREEGEYGTLQMTNSSLIVQHHPEDGAFFPVLMAKVTVDSDCRLSLSSTSESLFPDSVELDIQVPVIVLKDIKTLKVDKISVYDQSDDFVGSELVYEHDVVVGISVPSAGSYSVRATSEGKLHHVHESSSNGDLTLSVDAAGMKVFTDLKLTIYEGGTGSEGTGSEGTGSEGGSTDGSDSDDKDKKKKVAIAVSVVVVVCVIVAVVVVVGGLIKKKKGHHWTHSEETESVVETAESVGP